MDEKNAGLPALVSNLSGSRLPTWEELPDFELYMDQVLSLAERFLGAQLGGDGKGLTASMVNNYVKLGVVPAPVKKRYGRAQLATLLMVCQLKQVLPIASIQALLSAALEKESLEAVYGRFLAEYRRASEQSLEAARALDGASFDGVLRAALLARSEQALALGLLSLLGPDEG